MSKSAWISERGTSVYKELQPGEHPWVRVGLARRSIGRNFTLPVTQSKKYIYLIEIKVSQSHTYPYYVIAFGYFILLFLFFF